MINKIKFITEVIKIMNIYGNFTTLKLINSFYIF